MRTAWRCSLWASVQRSSARWRKTRLPGRNRAMRRGSDRLQRSHCLRSNSASACTASCCSGASRTAKDCSKRRGDGIVRAVEAMHPFLHHMDVTQFSQAAEEALPCFLHLLPGWIRVDGSDAVGHGSSSGEGPHAGRAPGRAAKATLARSHSSRTRCIQKARPDFLLADFIGMSREVV